MTDTHKRMLSSFTALLFFFGALSQAAPPNGKGKPGGGNKGVDATASF